MLAEQRPAGEVEERGQRGVRDAAGGASLHPLMFCQVCLTQNHENAENCRQCGQKLLVLSGAAGSNTETLETGDEEFSLDEHLLERISILEEVLKRTGETTQKVLSALQRQEESILVHHAGMLALRDLLERQQVITAADWNDLWDSRMDYQFLVLEMRERFALVRDQVAGLYEGGRRPEFGKLLDEAEFALNGLDLERAMKALESAAALDRHNRELALLLGESHFQEGRLQSAQVHFGRLLETSPDHLRGLVYSGVLHLQDGEPDLGQKLLERAALRHPDAFLPHFCLGASLAGRGRLQAAARHLERAAEIDAVPQALYLLGRCHHETGRPVKAIRALGRALELDADFEECHHLIGLCYLDRGWDRKALQAFRTAQQLNPKRMRYRELVDYLSGRAGTDLPRTSPAAAALVARGEEAVRSGDGAEALHCYREALALDPDNPALLMSFALACRRLDRCKEVRTLTARVLESGPGELLRATAWATLIEALRNEGSHEEASEAGRRLLEEASSDFSKSIACYEMACNLVEMDGDLEQALDFAHRSLEHAPEELRQFPLAVLGWVHYKRNELEDAIDFLSESTELGPSTAALTRLGMALLASGDEEGAREALARANPLDERGGAIEDKMMEFMRDSARIIERAGR